MFCRKRVIGVLGVFSLLLSNVPPLLVFVPSAMAAPVAVFSDDFDQSDSSMTNGWDAFSGSSNPSRETDSWVRVGGSGRGMLMEGAAPNHTNDPDEGAEREIATKGYATLYIQYSRAFQNNTEGEDDSFVAKYSLDNGTNFTTLETVTPINTAAHSLSPVFTIANPNRDTKLILRFYVNGTDSNDKAAIDDVSVTGENPPLFYDGFESELFTTGGWTTEDGDDDPSIDLPGIVHDTGNDTMWTDDNSAASGHSTGSHATDGHGANIEGNSDANPDQAIQKSFDATGFQNIYVRYARRADDLETSPPDEFRARYSTDGGSNWTTLESIFDDTPYASVKFGPLVGTDNNPNVAFRFEVNGNNTNDELYLDDVVIWGERLPVPATVTIVKETEGGDGTEAFLFYGLEIAGTEVATVGGRGEETVSVFPAAEGTAYTVTESVPVGWDLTNVSCVGTEDLIELPAPRFTLEPGDDVTCTFHNVKKGTLNITKQLVNFGAAETEDLEFPIEIVGVDGGPYAVEVEAGASVGNLEIPLAPGTYAVTEGDIPDGWMLAEDGNGCEEVVIAAGLPTSCTITNKKESRIVIHKTAIGAIGTFHYTGLNGEGGLNVAANAQAEAGSNHFLGESFFDVFVDVDGEEFAISEELGEGSLWEQTSY